MKETFTTKEIKALLDKAYEETKREENPQDVLIAREMEQAWNRGAFTMLNRALLNIYQAEEGVSA